MLWAAAVAAAAATTPAEEEECLDDSRAIVPEPGNKELVGESMR